MKRLLIPGLLLGLLLGGQAQAQRPDAPLYAQRGPYPVGTQELVIDDGRGMPLTVTIWYPALNPNDLPEEAAYRVLIVDFQGHALRDAAPDLSGAPYPLVLFSHGAGGVRINSLWFTEHLASHGFVVLAADHPGHTMIDFLQSQDSFSTNVTGTLATRPLDLLRLLDYAAGTWGELADTDHVAVTGHSFGGWTALSAAGGRIDFDALGAWCADPPQPEADWALTPDQQLTYRAGACFMLAELTGGDGRDPAASIHNEAYDLETLAAEVATQRGLDAPPEGLWPATTDPRIQAVLAMAPWNGPIFGETGLADVSVPALIMVGSADSSTVPERDAVPMYRALGSEHKALAVFDHAGHSIFINECNDFMREFGLFSSCSDEVWDMARVHDLVNHTATAFLKAVLQDDREAASALAAIDFAGVEFTHSDDFSDF